MKTVAIKRPPAVLFITITAALCAGAVNGILGTGGGIVLTYLFTYLSVGDEKDSLACSIAVILPVSAISLFTYSFGYFTDITHFFATVIPAGAGGLLGAFLSDKANASFLRKLFAALVIYAGTTMVL